MYFNQNQSVKFLIELNIAQLTKRNNMDYFDIDRDYFVGVYIIKAKKMEVRMAEALSCCFVFNEKMQQVMSN